MGPLQQAIARGAMCLFGLGIATLAMGQPVEYALEVPPGAEGAATLPPPPSDTLFDSPRRLPSPLLAPELADPPPPTSPLPSESLAPPAAATTEPPMSVEEIVGEAAAVPAAEVEAVLEAEEPLPPTSWYRPTSWFRAPSWDTGFELGLNGSTGTSETLSFRTGGYVKRKSDARKINVSIYYNSNTADGQQTQSNALLDARHDWLYGDSPWSLFVMSQTFYDEFQAFDLNVNVTGGLGYQFIDTEWVKLSNSFGAGASREFGGADDDWVPEGQFGFDYEQKISDVQRFYANVDFFPEFADFGDYRVLTEIGMEIDLSRPSNVSLKLGATDRFDSNPGGVAAHNTNYSVLLLWKQ